MSTSERPSSFSFSGLRHLVDVQHRPARRRQRGAGVGVAVRVVDRVADGVAEGRVGDEGEALVDRRRLGEEAVELEGALVELGAVGQVEGAVERLRHRHRVHGGALVGGLVDEALGVVPAGGGRVDLRAGAEALDDHRHPGQQRHLDEELPRPRA